MDTAIHYFKTTVKIITGIKSVTTLPEEIKQLGGKKVFIFTDEGIVKAGICDQVLQILEGSVESVSVFGKVPPEPPLETIYECLKLAQEAQCDLIIGLGGGSAMDVAKVISVLLTNEKSLDQMIGVNLVEKRGIPKILIPTTAGTGSEVTPIVILTDQSENLKKGVVSDFLFPETAILDPELTVSLPPGATAASGMDALIHAVEAYTSLNATAMTDHLALRAIELVVGNIRSAWANGSNLEARMSMLEGSLLAGQAFANAGVTAVHAFAYPLGGEFHVAHGVANTVMLCAVLRFNMIANLKKFAALGRLLCPDVTSQDSKLLAEAGIRFLEGLIVDLQLPRTLQELKVPREAIPGMAEGVMKVTRLLANNPRKITLKDANDIYQIVY
ncbi:MAG: iron-containing alcohol dehydrogenase [Deltaproteobacteria bacterium]|nr:iron-containing alcohol dehydrogenase [Deltaproteobacteria bacterium]